MKFSEQIVIKEIDFHQEESALLNLKKDFCLPDEQALMLWQDPTFIGFVNILDNMVQIQPEGPKQLDFELLKDLRLFGSKGEWHIWKSYNEQYVGRLIIPQTCTEIDYIEEKHFLWGSDKCDTRAKEDTDWSCVKEDRGMKLWLPWKQNSNLPAYLKVRQFVEQDEATGLAGIVDAMLLMPNTQ